MLQAENEKLREHIAQIKFAPLDLSALLILAKNILGNPHFLLGIAIGSFLVAYVFIGGKLLWDH